jgi:D-alanine-D-alanine ligase
MLRAKKIGVLMGGWSSEREVSLKSGEAVFRALAERGYDVYRIFVDPEVDTVLRQLRIEVAFLALHGHHGEDGTIQGLLEMLGIPYTGSGVLASALAMDKVKTKEILARKNLPVAPAYVWDTASPGDPHERHGDFGYPCVVKPVDGGSSIGVHIVNQAHELPGALVAAAAVSDRVMVERFVAGKEVAIALLDGQALGAVEIAPKDGFYDYDNKYTAGRTDYLFPARLSPERYRGVLTLAERAASAIGTSGISRVDMIVSDIGNEVILEINTIPGLTETSLVPKVAKGCGIEFGALCEEMLARARLYNAPRSRGRSEGLSLAGAHRRAMERRASRE